MSSTWTHSGWKDRLTQRLEPLLKSPGLVKEISTYQGVPFALFAYPLTAERELRREVGMLGTRVEHDTIRRVKTISMADLLWVAIRTAYPPDGKALFDAERSMGRWCMNRNWPATILTQRLLTYRYRTTLARQGPSSDLGCCMRAAPRPFALLACALEGQCR